MMTKNKHVFSNLLGLIKYPLITEKTLNLRKRKNKQVFIVDKKLTKNDIKFVFKKFFDLSLINVHTLPLKQKNRSSYKKAIFFVKENELFNKIFAYA